MSDDDMKKQQVRWHSEAARDSLLNPDSWRIERNAHQRVSICRSQAGERQMVFFLIMAGATSIFFLRDVIC